MKSKIKCPECSTPLNVGKLLSGIKSKAKSAASRANGAKGGRPKKKLESATKTKV
jgi:hypothetical protein